MDHVKEYALAIIRGLVAHPDMARIDVVEGEDDMQVLEIVVHRTDRGMVIGKEGRTIDAIRRLMIVSAWMNGVQNLAVEVVDR